LRGQQQQQQQQQQQHQQKLLLRVEANCHVPKSNDNIRPYFFILRALQDGK